MEEDEDSKVVLEIQKRICRCCLNSSKSVVNAASFREAFSELAGITVETSDGLPQCICTQCLTLLKKAVRFRSQIIRTDNVLREYLSRCAPFPIDEGDPELSKYATPHLSQTQILQFDTDKTENGYHEVLQHVTPMAAVYDIECKMEYEEPIIKLEQEYSDVEDDLPLLELRSNKEDSVLEEKETVKTTSKSVKRKKDSKCGRKKKKYRDESESNDESENEDESYKNVPTLEPLESNDPLESIEEITDLEKMEITDEKFKRLKKKIQINYLRSYKQFIRWKYEKNITAFTENVFLTYFNELDLKMKPATLVNIYCMLKATLLALKGIKIDNFCKLKKFLKERSQSYGIKPLIFKKDEIDRFLKTAPDDKFLAEKVVLIFGICGGCLMKELLKLTINDLETHANVILVKVRDKMNRERSFMIPENYSDYVRKYMNLRPKYLGLDNFFLYYRKGVFQKMAMGKNKMCNTPKEVAQFLKLKNPERYSGHALRKTFDALFNPKKGSNDYFESESDSESENRENESESYAIPEKSDVDYTTANSNDNMPNTSDEIANFNINMANSDDVTANSNHKIADSIYEDGVIMPSGRILKVPKKSGKSYVRAYELFTIWMEERAIDNITEDVMIDYFKHLSQEFRASSLWNLFSMLRNTILTQNSVDIKKFEGVKQFLRSNFEGFERRTSKVFTNDEIDMFLNSAPDYNYLAMKVILILGISVACTNHELTNLTTDNVKIHNNTIVVKIKDCNKKQRRFYILRRYSEYVRRYMNLRPKNLGHKKFFFKINNRNYTKQFVGRNTVRLVPKEIASFLVLPNPEAYNGHCFKRTSAALFGTKVCNIESESYCESENDSRNESGDFQIENSNIQIDFEPIAQNIKQENVENTTIQDNCKIHENSTKIHENSTKIHENCTETQENCTETQENCTETQENSINLPESTPRGYFEAYKWFQTWMIENDFDTYTEDVLLKYFKELSTKLKPNTLCSRYSMLRVTIKLRNGIDIYNYMMLKTFINSNTRGFHSKKSRVFSLKEIEMFLNDAPDLTYLHWKVALIFGISGACQCKELVEITMDNIKFRGKIITVKIISSDSQRKYFIEEKYVHIIKKYIDSRPELCSNRFLLSFRNNSCCKKGMGKNSVGAIPKGIAKYLNLANPEEYTAQCFRRTSFSLFGRK